MPWDGFRLVGWALACLLVAAAARGQEPEELLSTPLAEAFGSAPLVRGLRLSPDGNRISFMQMHSDGYPLVNVYDITSGRVTTALAGERDGYDVSWCSWANEERLLCSLRFIESFRAIKYAQTRLAAVNADGSEPVLMLQDDRVLRAAQFQDNIVDWLPDDPEHVLLGLRINPNARVNETSIGTSRSAELAGSRVLRLNIYTSEVAAADSEQDTFDWITDGHGTVRLRVTVSSANRTWFVRDEGGSWSKLHQTALDDLDDAFSPIAFLRDAKEVIFYDRREGRTALFAMGIDGDRARRVLYSHPSMDVAGVFRIGRYNRIVGAVTIEDSPTLHFFEPDIERVHDMLKAEFPGMSINVIDEDWAERRYLVFVNSDRDAGTYYAFDTEAPELTRFARAFPALGEHELAVMQPISYPAADGTQIPAYLTLPPEGPSGAGVVLPHGGPSSRDYWQFDFLSQFLATRGYAVLQSNYRGSDGYGQEWEGSGGFQDWRQAVDDIADGARYLVDAGIAEPGRICIVGWSYGGYAALLSAIEYERVYQCAVSIAGVTDPALLGQNAAYFVGGRRSQTFLGSGDEVRNQGSPLRRADEIVLPTLLFHPHDDINVPFEQSLELRDALLDERANVELIEYEHAEHSIRPPRYRIDMLARLGAFLETHLAKALPNFYSQAPSTPGMIEIIDFGSDASQPNGICNDARFSSTNGRVLRDRTARVRGILDDATDCRRQFLSGEIVLRDAIAPNQAANLPAEERTTVFVEPSQQTGVAIVSLDGVAVDSRSGVPVILGRPGYRIVGVRGTDLDYGCIVGIDGDATIAAEPAYVIRPAGGDTLASLVRIPAYAGRYYRILAGVADDVLFLRVTDASDERVIVDQREALASGCN
ncbi:MAG TPA: alpha/beta fold hydrolase [Gammaproteobacteria bacterium]|nr:alpha/beta fold hydrolase [Gammaproteobacteria bacterium]